VGDGRIVSTKGRNTPERVWDAQKDGSFEGFPMAVLVNHYSASASEIVSACLQDNHRAVVIGERTWGKGSVQNVIELEGGKSALKLTTASYHRPNGKNIHKFPDAKDSDEWGVMPDAGFELKLNPQQTGRLIEYRHDRDILIAKRIRAAGASKEQAAATPVAEEPAKPDAPKADPAKPEDAKPAEPKAEEAGVKPVADEAKSNDEAKAYVDTQLQKAMDYLTQELARAQ